MGQRYGSYQGKAVDKIGLVLSLLGSASLAGTSLYLALKKWREDKEK